ncbi:MAG: polysaccharide deacetylase family protein [Xanthomonadales bacterium]|nr:polysaccharide deacetylase family protein [Xanthomonadales bacterium]
MIEIVAAIALIHSAPDGPDSSIYSRGEFTFPGGETRVVVLSYDDGPAQDRRWVELLNRYGIKGTFHLNSGRLGQAAEWMEQQIGRPGEHVTANELKDLYAGHEISGHTVNHPYLTELQPPQVRLEVQQDVAALEQLAGYPVSGLAYPFGAHNEQVVQELVASGVNHARTAQATGHFEVPGDFLRWNPTAHHSQALEAIHRFLDSTHRRPSVLMIWGHSWEFDADRSDNNWQLAESICTTLAGQDNLWSAGFGELVAYLEAVKGLQMVDGNWVNPSRTTVWIQTDSGARPIPPG